MKTYEGLLNFRGNLLCAIDLETTGLDPDYHEIIQIGIVPLNSEIEPYPGLRPFYLNVAPQFSERAEGEALTVHGLELAELALNSPHPDKVLDLFVQWFEQLDLPVGRKIIPLAHNWIFEAGFLRKWMGFDLFHDIFYGHARDSMQEAIVQNDRANMCGERAPYTRVSLQWLCNHFAIVNENPHDALSDALAAAKVYKTLLQESLSNVL